MTLPFINLFVVVAILLFVKGFRKHRSTWTPRAWRHFAGAFVLSLVPFVAGILLAKRVEQRFQLGDTITPRDPSLLVLIPLATLALLAPVFLLSWFASSETARHFSPRGSSAEDSPDTG